MRTRSVPVLLGVALAALLAACGDQPGGTEPTPDPTATPTSGAAQPSPSLPTGPPVLPTSPPARPGSPPALTPAPSDRPGLVTLTGEIYAGVEAGCMLLATSSGDYLLIGSAAAPLRTGTTVTVRGQVRTNLATTCQQGTPFEVMEVLD